MANPEHLERLQQGVRAFNAWRKRNSAIKPDLSRAKLSGTKLCKANFGVADLSDADLSEADLRGADFSGANLVGANLTEADLDRTTLVGANLSGANLSRACLSSADLVTADLAGANLAGASLSEADLCDTDLKRANLIGAYIGRALLDWADLSGANLRNADLRQANLSSANLTDADLRDSTLSQASLIDTRLNRADLSGARLWETQRSGWSIEGVICLNAFWDRAGVELTGYSEGEFERLFAEKPRIVLRYPGGLLPIDLVALPIVIERLQVEHPDSEIKIRSIQDDVGGGSVTITLEDRAERSADTVQRELLRLETELTCLVSERDFLRQVLGTTITQAFAKFDAILARPRTETHIHGPTGVITVEGPAMSRDRYNLSGQAGSVGPGSHAKGSTFQQNQRGIDLSPADAESEAAPTSAASRKAT